MTKIGDRLKNLDTEALLETLAKVTAPAPLLVQMSPPLFAENILAQYRRLTSGTGEAAAEKAGRVAILGAAGAAAGKAAGKLGVKAAEAAGEKAVATRRPDPASPIEQWFEDLGQGLKIFFEPEVRFFQDAGKFFGF